MALVSELILTLSQSVYNVLFFLEQLTSSEIGLTEWTSFLKEERFQAKAIRLFLVVWVGIL